MGINIALTLLEQDEQQTTHTVEVRAFYYQGEEKDHVLATLEAREQLSSSMIVEAQNLNSILDHNYGALVSGCLTADYCATSQVALSCSGFSLLRFCIPRVSRRSKNLVESG